MADNNTLLTSIIGKLQSAQTLAQSMVSAPPVPTVGAVDPIIAACPGGLTSRCVYGNDAASAPLMTEWLPWQGQDDTPIGVASVGNGYVGPVVIDVSKACRVDVPPQIGLRSGGGEVTMASRSTVGRAILLVSYTDQTSETLTLDAEQQTDTSTAYWLPPTQKLDVTTKNSAWFRFAPPRKAVAKATLTIAIIKTWTPGKINAVAFTAGYLPQPATLATWGGSVLYRSECWEDGPAYVTERIKSTDQFKQCQFVSDPAGRALELWLDPRWSGILDLKLGIWPEATEAWATYKIKFMDGAEKAVTENGKLPGFATATRPDDANTIAQYGLAFPPGTIGTLEAGNGGAPVHGNDGWSDRSDWLLPRPAPHPLAGRWPLSSYVYHPDFIDTNGEQLPWSYYGTGVLDKERWYEVGTRIKINSLGPGATGNRDGQIEARIDGVLAGLRTNLRFRDKPPYTPTTLYGVPTNLAIRNFWLAFYHGGHGVPNARVPLCRVRDFTISRVA